MDVIEQALRGSDEKVALKLLGSVGALRSRGRGPINPKVQELQMQLRDKLAAQKTREWAMLQRK